MPGTCCCGAPRTGGKGRCGRRQCGRVRAPLLRWRPVPPRQCGRGASDAVDDEGRRAGGWDAAVGGCVAGEGGAVGGEGNGVVISRSSSIYFCLKWRSRSYHDVKYLFNKTHMHGRVDISFCDFGSGERSGVGSKSRFGVETGQNKQGQPFSTYKGRVSTIASKTMTSQYIQGRNSESFAVGSTLAREKLCIRLQEQKK